MIIVGAGVAGLMAALAAAPHPVTLIDPAPFGAGAASWLSQGGMAAAVGADDSIDLHSADTLAAGAGLCDPASVARIIAAGPEVVKKLLKLGVMFDRTPEGTLALGLEAAHSRKRILHGGGDRTGATIMDALVERVKACPSISVMQARVERILVGDGGVEAVQCVRNGESFVLGCSRVLLATGGIGGIFRYSTNPSGAMGQGLTLALEAGARLKDIEFIQFHPTALAGTQTSLPLISEAVRGEGARLVDENAFYFMQGHDLAPRDVVARAVFAHLAQGHKTFLDVSGLSKIFPTRFPGIYQACLQAGIDPQIQPIPIQPAAHYHMGGVAVDELGRTTIEGLYAAGEVACTGLHGANRLASNSLLEAAICGWQAGEHMAGQMPGKQKTPKSLPVPPPASPEPVRDIMTTCCGVSRAAAGLCSGIEALSGLPADNRVAQLALRIVEAALNRPISVGAHMRTDSPVEKSA